MRLLHPLLLLTAIPVVVLLLVTRRAGIGAAPRRTVAVLRYSSLTLLVLALAQPQIGHGSAGPTVLALDRSASIDPADASQERAWLHAARGQECGASCPVIQFGGVGRLTAPSEGLLPALAGGPLDGGESDLQGALQLALARARSGGRIAVLSDGRQTTGEAAAAIPAALARHVRIDVVPLGVTRPDAGITRLQVPQALHGGDPLSLELTVRSTVSSSATLSLSIDGVSRGRQQVQLLAGDDPFLFSLRAPRAAGGHSYSVAVAMPGDRVAQDNRLTVTVRVVREPKVLVVSSSSSRVTAMLRADGMNVSVAPPNRLPSLAAAYAGEDAVVLDDVSAPQLGAARARALSAAVQSGGLGLLVLGGPHSFSLGAYYHSPLQQSLPVSSLVPGSLQRRNIGLELILDRSGSMSSEAGGVPKIEMAQEAAQVANKFLASHSDELGIVDFDVEPHTLVPLIRVTPGKVAAEVNRRIAGLRAEGGTNIYKALAAGARQIEASKAPDRHIILLTDGVSEPGSYASLLPTLAKDHISVSTVALGGEADFSLLRAIAKSTGGRYYATSNARELPRIFAHETRLSARPVRLHGRIAVMAGAVSPVVRSLSGQSLTPLGANVVTTLKPGAQADLLSQDKGYPPDPALAQWQYGLGRVVTWTAGLTPEWARVWAGRSALWQNAVRFLERGVGPSALTPTIVAGSSRELQIDTVQNAGVSLEEANIGGSLLTPDGRTIPLRFSETAPSHYVASVPALAQGVYGYAVSDGAAASNGLLAVPYPAEYRLGRGDDTPLGSLAAATGGRVLSAAHPSEIEARRTSLWWWAALAALIFFMSGVALSFLGRRPDGPPPEPAPSQPLTARPVRPDGPTRTEGRAAARS
jgi:Ca-activated chloride channel homolog